MSGAVAQPVISQPGWRSSLLHRQLHTYPATAPRMMYLAITVLATVTLYYELYVGGSVSTLQLTNLNMSFTFYVVLLAVGSAIGAIGSLTAGLFALATFVVGAVEGICLVATPALIRDYSPQVGRATAMGFWTSGPVLGSLIVAVVGSATIPAV